MIQNLKINNPVSRADKPALFVMAGQVFYTALTFSPLLLNPLMCSVRLLISKSNITTPCLVRTCGNNGDVHQTPSKGSSSQGSNYLHSEPLPRWLYIVWSRLLFLLLSTTQKEQQTMKNLKTCLFCFFGGESSKVSKINERIVCTIVCTPSSNTTVYVHASTSIGQDIELDSSFR